MKYEEIKRQIDNSVKESLAARVNTDDKDVLKEIDRAIQEECRKIPIPIDWKLSIRKEVFNGIRRLDILQPFLDDDAVTEIMVNGTAEIFLEKKGRLIPSGCSFSSADKLMDIIGRIAAGINRTVNITSPIMDGRLDDGSRVCVVLPPVSLEGPILTIRRFPDKAMDDKDLLFLESVNEEVLLFLKCLVRAGYNILISGGTGAGKTTFLNIMSNYIPKTERIITIEDSAELQIKEIDNLVRLEARKANAEGANCISIRDLIKTSLRMRPDRIVVGEVRGEEAIDMLQAFNVGQDGSLSTIHANSAADALLRLETMIMLNTDIPLAALRRQIVSGVDIIVHLGRLRDKSRRLLEIREVIGMKNNEVETSLLYEFCEEAEINGKIKGSFMRRADLYHTSKIIRAGLTDAV